MRGKTKAEKLEIFRSDFERLKKNREAMSLPELMRRCGKEYQALIAQVLEDADWYADTYIETFAFPTDPQDLIGNAQLNHRISVILREENAPGGLVERYRAALIDRLDMGEFKKLVWERYERLRQEAYNPYWARHCHRLNSGWIYNDILKKFWLPSESGKSGGWINSDYSGWDGRFPPVVKEEHNG
ncbi:MAG: hypothetical protein K2O18_07255 [Oscillospiraceae bacterium]|nr:hypothetical protein [Oscillospiraceae bacterium]